MPAYLLRKLLYAIPILLGVNLLLFFLFFVVHSPDSMAERILGEKRVTPQQVAAWKHENGYDLPRLFNAAAPGAGKVTQTIFWKKCMPLFRLDFGRSDLNGAPISREILSRIGPSLAITVPMFLLSLAACTVVAMLVAFRRGSYLDVTVLVACVGLMSVSVLFYIVGGQFLLAKYLRLFPISGFDAGAAGVKFLVLPVVIGVLSGLGGSIRFNRAVFLEEVNRDYVRTARAKGLGEGAVLFKHALKNALIPILTSVVVTIPFLIMGNLLLENFFGIPGLGGYLVDAFNKLDFAAVRAMVFLGSLLYILGLLMVDVMYTVVDPRIKLE